MLKIILNNNMILAYAITDNTNKSIYFKDLEGYTYKLDKQTNRVYDFIDGSWRYMENLTNMMNDFVVL